MKHMLGRWHLTKPDKYPKLVVKAALCQNAYDEIGLYAPNAAAEQHTMMVNSMPDTRASMCLVGMTTQM